MIGLAFSFLLLAFPQVCPDAPAREPLKGSASIEVRPFADEADRELMNGPVKPKLGRAWYPAKTWTLRRADNMVDDFALDTAEKNFQAMLRHNPGYAPAHNGLGLVDRYRTSSSNQNHRNRREDLYQQAIQHFMTALRYQPNYIEARLNLGELYFEQGRYGEAQEEFTRAFLLAPNDAQVLEKMGMSLVQAGREHEGLPYLEKSARLHNREASVHYWTGRAHLAQGRENEAHQAFQDALNHDPHNAPTWYQLGLLYERQGNGSAAVDAFKKALAIKPEYRDAALTLARHYENRGDLSLALEQVKNLYESYPDDTDLLYQITNLAMRNKQPEVAVAYYQRQLFNNPDDPRAVKGLSEAHAAIARHHMAFPDLAGESQAVEEAEQALVYRPENYQARFIQVKLESGTGPLGNRPMTSAEMDAVLHQPVKAGQAVSLKQAEVLLWRFQFAEAEQHFRVLLNQTPTPQDSLNMGEMLLQTGMPGLAEECFHKTLARDPGNKAAMRGIEKVKAQYEEANRLYTEAITGRHVRRLDETVRLLNGALSKNLRHVQAHYRLAQAYESSKDYPRAADHYYAYVRLEPGLPERRRANQRINKLKRQMQLSGGMVFRTEIQELSVTLPSLVGLCTGDASFCREASPRHAFNGPA